MKHTSEPWRLDVQSTFIQISASNLDICEVWSTGSNEEDHENAKRIISCVNAMAGIEDPQKFRDNWEAIKHLELDAYQEAQEQIEKKNIELMNQSSLLDLKDQRIKYLENLLQDLKTILDRGDSILPDSLMYSVIKTAIK